MTMRTHHALRSQRTSLVMRSILSISQSIYRFFSDFRVKATVLLVIGLGISSDIQAQIPGAIIEFEGKTGILIPRVTTAERADIIAPADGLLVYDSTLSHFYYFNGLSGTWSKIRVDEETSPQRSNSSENLQIPHQPSSSANWNVQGNIGADQFSSDPPLLGTADNFPVVFITNDQERMRILADGNIAIVRSLEIGENLVVKQNVDLNTLGGETMNHGPFTVTSQSPTILTGSLTSEQNVDLNTVGGQTMNHGPLTVTNQSPTLLTGRLTVDQKTLLNADLEVFGSTILHGLFKVADNYTSLFTGPVTISDPTQSAPSAVSSGALVVSGGVGIGKNLNVGGNLDIAGTSVFGGPVSFASPVTISALEESTSTMTGSLIVGGGVGIGKRLNVGGATMLESTLGVTGATTLGSTLAVGGNVSVNVNKFTIDALTGNTAIDGTLGVKGNLGVNGTKFTVDAPTGNTAVDGTLGVKGNLSVNGTKFTVAAPTGNTAVDGTLGVKGNLSVNSTKFTVDAPTGNTAVDGTLGVKGNLSVNGNKFMVDAITGNTSVLGTLSSQGNLSVNGNKFTVDAPTGNTAVAGTLAVVGGSTFNNTLTVKGPTGDQSLYNSYPLKVEGSDQGVAIKVNGSRSNNTNFVSFWDDTKMWGRIEGQRSSELGNDPEHVRIKSQIDLAVIIASIQVATASLHVIIAGAQAYAAATSTTGCVGFGACATVPIPSIIVFTIANLTARIANVAAVSLGLDGAVSRRDNYDTYKATNIGVTFQSGAGDYAEWLPKANPSEEYIPGFIVGMKNGKISLNTEDADKILAISTNPIVLGNMPAEGDEALYEKVAFMGQVPIHVIGKVNKGDYILPSGNHDGLAKAIPPAKMTADDYIKIVGMAWSSSTNDVYNQINVAIGLNDGDISKLVSKQMKEIEELHKEMEELQAKKLKRNALLAKLVPGYKEAMGISDDDITKTDLRNIKKVPETHINESVEIVMPDPSTIVYFEITRDQIMEGIKMAETMFIESGGDLNTHPFWMKMKTDSVYSEAVIMEMEKKLQKAMHTHKRINEESAQKN